MPGYGRKAKFRCSVYARSAKCLPGTELGMDERLALLGGGRCDFGACGWQEGWSLSPAPAVTGRASTVQQHLLPPPQTTLHLQLRPAWAHCIKRRSGRQSGNMQHEFSPLSDLECYFEQPSRVSGVTLSWQSLTGQPVLAIELSLQNRADIITFLAFLKLLKPSHLM